MAILSKLACCFRPPSSSSAPAPAAARRRPDKAEKRRWVDEQVGLHLAARVWDGYSYGAGYGKGGAVDVSRYGDIGLEAALGYEFERRWWFAEMTRLLTLVDEDDAAAAPDAGKSGGVVKVHPLAAAAAAAAKP
ncbi:Os11g0248100 [Oryza sativa Japonica Group]|uniref:Uncharacterized protein n=2 Tax=Oryza sativa subsp. japonica TaxID=39947 RepID=A0A0P0Y0N6_ORYSJ|nr:hypothetical protein [Oryza sativa Japonica Group]AAX96756.1 hypothetical protein LOC_Os11g14290 [Oryza sativa Japonica Group]ABA92361.1 hypothetical protein LOC_Os11g14290 [Oryza sativa Japonica Group]BAT13431.1 Os11g0248100 [Oryza sativa Japonica Group]